MLCVIFVLLATIIFGDPIDDLRNTYDPSKLLNEDKFLLHLARSYEFAQSVKHGYQEIIHGSVSDIDIFKAIYSIRVVDGTVEMQESIRSKNYFIWSFYETHLNNFIQDGVPSSAFYELFTNLYSQLRFFVANWYSNLLLGQKVQNLLRIRQRIGRSDRYASISKIATEHPRFKYMKDITEQLYNSNFLDIEQLKVLIKTLMTAAEQWDREPALNEPLLITLNSDISDLTLYLRFLVMLYPIVENNLEYLGSLETTCRPQLRDISYFDQVANEKIKRILTLRAKTGNKQWFGLNSVAPIYDIKDRLRIHELGSSLYKNGILPDENVAKMIREKIEQNVRIPFAAVDVIYWQAFQKGFQTAEKLIKPLMRRFKPTFEKRKNYLDSKSTVDNNEKIREENEIILPNMSSYKKENYVVQTSCDDDSNDENEPPLFQTSYEAYQYWYLQELARKENKEKETKAISTKTTAEILSSYGRSECSRLDFLGPGVFKHARPGMFYQIIGQPSDTKKCFRKLHLERIELHDVTLSYRDFRTLCSVMYPIMNSHNVKKSDVEKLIEKLGGTIESTTGSIDRVFIPVFGSRTTTWHRNHGGNKLGTASATGMRRVLTSFNIDPLDFQYVSKT